MSLTSAPELSVIAPVLSSVTISDSVSHIESGAFYNCASLTSITIPASVAELGVTAFANCPNLTSALFQGNAPLVDNNYPFGGSIFENAASNFSVYYYKGRYRLHFAYWNDGSSDSYPASIYGTLSQTIFAFAAISPVAFGATPFDITPPVTSSGLPVTVTVQSGPATISGNTVTITGSAPWFSRRTRQATALTMRRLR